MKLLGIDTSRLVSRTLVAEHIYIPCALSCSVVPRNPMEFRLLAAESKRASKIKVKERQGHGKTYSPYLIKKDHLVSLSHQVDNQDYEKLLRKKNLKLLGRKGHAWGSRQWDDDLVKRLVRELPKRFPNHNIVIHSSDLILHPDFCYACEFIEMETADILVGKSNLTISSTSITMLNKCFPYMLGMHGAG